MALKRALFPLRKHTYSNVLKILPYKKKKKKKKKKKNENFQIIFFLFLLKTYNVSTH